MKLHRGINSKRKTSEKKLKKGDTLRGGAWKNNKKLGCRNERGKTLVNPAVQRDNSKKKKTKKFSIMQLTSGKKKKKKITRS